MKVMTNAELEKCYKAAISREQEANRNWSAATKEWIVERNALKAIIKEQAEEIEQLKADRAKIDEVLAELPERLFQAISGGSTGTGLRQDIGACDVFGEMTVAIFDDALQPTIHDKGKTDANS